MTQQTWHALRPVGLEFVSQAEHVFRVEEQVAAPLDRVWEAFADASTWPHWFPGVERASYDGAPPYGVGTIRRSSVGGVEYEETMLVWDRGRQWTYRVDRATAPIARAQLEISEFEAVGDQTRVRWTLAVDPLEKLGYMADGTPFEQFLANLLRDALRGLERFLGQGA
ncbi:MAG: SRPBCC family protein [Myxococcota bacterium]